jgi:hypothetical protein
MYEHHNPSIALPLMTKALQALGKDWQDVSHCNDCCAVIAIELHKDDPRKNVSIQMYFPNAEITVIDTEEFAEFWIKAQSDPFENEMEDEIEDEIEDICLECETLEEAILNAQKLEATL